MAQVIGTVTAAGPVTKERRDGTTYSLNIVKIDDQEYVARKDVCGVAHGLLAQRVSAITRVEVKGNYTNFYLDFIEPAGGASAPGQAEYAQQAQAAQQQQQTYVQQQPQTFTQEQPPPQQPITPAQQAQEAQVGTDTREKAKQLSIHRQTAGKVAAALAQDGQSVWDFWANVDALVRYFETGVYPSAGLVQNQTYSQPLPPSPGMSAQPDRQNAGAYQPFPRDEPNQFVPESAYADPGSQAPVQTDDDIPF